MNRKALGLLILPIAFAAVLCACSGTNPTPPCNIAHGDYAAKYLLESGSGSCARLAGEAIGLDKFYKEDGGASVVGFQPHTATYASTADGGFIETFPPSSLGTLRSETPEGDRCFVEGVGAIIGHVPPTRFAVLADGGVDDPHGRWDGGGVLFVDGLGDEHYETKPAAPFSYELTNVEFYNIAMAPSAQQFKATLEYTEGSCTATYKVVALYPAVPCYAYDRATFEPLYNADGTYQLAPSLCEPFEDYDAGRIRGSGIFHEFETVCDPVTALCVLKADDIGPGTHKAK